MKKALETIEGENSPSRNIGRSKHGKQTTVFPSRKNGCLVICETRLEADACYHWEFDEEVISYSPQPEQLTLKFKNTQRKYTADFKVNYKNCLAKLFEIKPDNIYLKPKHLEFYKAVQLAALERNLDFEIIVDSQIRRQPYLNNLKHIYYQMRGTISFEVEYLQDQLLNMKSPTRIIDLLNMESPASFRAIATAIFTKKLKIEMEKPISMNSKVYWIATK